jgi:hypothetical protein
MVSPPALVTMGSQPEKPDAQDVRHVVKNLL